jgi:predicted nuclease of restriction endonuclease-like (RecB) superfamily
LLSGELKDRIRRAQLRASVAVNRGPIELYWRIGKGLVERQKAHGWGNSVIDHLGEDRQEDFPGMGGFSRTNVYRMRAFFLAYRDLIVPQAVGQIPEEPPAATTEIPWGHNVVLVERVKDPAEPLCYAKASVEHGWSRSILALQIEGGIFARQGRAATLVRTDSRSGRHLPRFWNDGLAQESTMTRWFETGRDSHDDPVWEPAAGGA